MTYFVAVRNKNLSAKTGDATAGNCQACAQFEHGRGAEAVPNRPQVLGEQQRCRPNLLPTVLHAATAAALHMQLKVCKVTTSAGARPSLNASIAVVVCTYARQGTATDIVVKRRQTQSARKGQSEQFLSWSRAHITAHAPQVVA